MLTSRQRSKEQKKNRGIIYRGRVRWRRKSKQVQNHTGPPSFRRCWFIYRVGRFVEGMQRRIRDTVYICQTYPSRKHFESFLMPKHRHILWTSRAQTSIWTYWRDIRQRTAYFIRIFFYPYPSLSIYTLFLILRSHYLLFIYIMFYLCGYV